MTAINTPEKIKKMRSGMNNLANGVFRPISRKYDEAEHEYPKELEMFRSMSIMGKKPKANGDEKKKKKKLEPGEVVIGQNLGTVVSVEEMCWGDAGFLLTMPNAGLGNAAIAAVATDAQLELFGDKWAAMAITEPASGSDSGSIQTTAELDGDEWVLNGEKIFVTCADRCDVVVVWARVVGVDGSGAIKSFIVEKETPGFKLEHLEHKLGIRASDTGTFVLNNCRIPKTNLLGDDSGDKKKTEGFKGVMKTFDNTRPMVAAMALGVARAAVDFTRETMQAAGIEIDYSANPNNVSAVLKEFYLMEANLEAMRLLTWKAAWMADNDVANTLEASMSKAKAGRYGTLITQKCCELLGPMGFSREYLAEKWMRDSKIMDIFEGTGQIQHLIIARNILKLTRRELQ